MAQQEKRVKLTDKQFKLLIEANTRRNEAFKAAEDAARHLNTVSALVLDSKGLPEALDARIDDSTKELVWTEEVVEGDAAPKKDKKSK